MVVPIWKGKGDRQDCSNYRGITLLSVPGKVLVHFLLTRIRTHLLKHQYWWSADVSSDRECLQPMSISRRCLTQCIERHSGIFCVSVGFLQVLLVYINWPLLRDCKCCEVWRRHVQFLPCEYGCETGLCAYSITFQHMHGLSTRQIM